jgi:inorganic pyrophosphatase
MPSATPNGLQGSSPLSYLGKLVFILIDRPLGSLHSEHGFFYEVNYGFVPGTLAPDGEPLDAYVLGPDGPLEEFTGICIAVIEREDDVESKLVIATEGQSFSQSEIISLTSFQEHYFKIRVVMLGKQ